MNDSYLQQLAEKQGIDLERLQHEQREILFLEAIAGDPVLALHLAFKGGTAMRLVYGCDRYSDDLDFDLVRTDASQQEIFNRLRSVATTLKLEEKDAALKRNTMLINMRDQKGQRGLKIEVALQDNSPKGAAVKNIISPVYAASVNILTYPLPLLLSGKILAVLNRKDRTPRDLYDLFWLLSRDVQPEPSYWQTVTSTAPPNSETLYEDLRSTVDTYDDKRIASELCAMLSEKQREWVRVNLKERTKELLMLRMKE